MLTAVAPKCARPCPRLPVCLRLTHSPASWNPWRCLDAHTTHTHTHTHTHRKTPKVAHQSVRFFQPPLFTTPRVITLCASAKISLYFSLPPPPSLPSTPNDKTGEPGIGTPSRAPPPQYLSQDTHLPLSPPLSPTHPLSSPPSHLSGLVHTTKHINYSEEQEWTAMFFLLYSLRNMSIFRLNNSLSPSPPPPPSLSLSSHESTTTPSHQRNALPPPPMVLPCREGTSPRYHCRAKKKVHPSNSPSPMPALCQKHRTQTHRRAGTLFFFLARKPPFLFNLVTVLNNRTLPPPPTPLPPPSSLIAVVKKQKRKKNSTKTHTHTHTHTYKYILTFLLQRARFREGRVGGRVG